jgi:hypothetical protein
MRDLIDETVMARRGLDRTRREKKCRRAEFALVGFSPIGSNVMSPAD